NFFYTSNIPVILAAALIINITMMGSMLATKGMPVLGQFSETGQPEKGGLAYFITAPHGILQHIILGGIDSMEIIRAFTYLIFLTILCVIFAIFWVETANMGPEAVAEQISSIGMQIPGFRKDKRILTKVLSKYIYPLTILGAIAVGILAAVADFTGALGTGTGILLTVMILHNFYERISMQYLEDMNPAIRKFFEL
ncbi:MAG: preprotein translocase subunit SecY, partial [Candidatus Aenigmarchaeota archaeon ex4484_56]